MQASECIAGCLEGALRVLSGTLKFDFDITLEPCIQKTFPFVPVHCLTLNSGQADQRTSSLISTLYDFSRFDFDTCDSLC